MKKNPGRKARRDELRTMRREESKKKMALNNNRMRNEAKKAR